MLTPFNRRELCSVCSMQRQSDLRRILSDAGIDYTIKTINRKSPSPLSSGSRAYTGTLGENLDCEYTYTFYVHRDDYEKALFFVRSEDS